MVWIKKIFAALANIERLLEITLQHNSVDAAATPAAPPAVQEEQRIELVEWMTPREVRAYLRISERTYYRRRQKGILVGVKVEGKVCYRKEEVAALLARDNQKWRKSSMD